MSFIPPLGEVRLVMADGLSFVCATCRHYWEARKNGVPGHQCAATNPCGSPLRKDVFSEYDGPLRDDLMNICFVCGERSKYGLAVKGKKKVVGVCLEHLKMFKGALGDVGVEGGVPDLSPKTLSEILAAEDEG